MNKDQLEVTRCFYETYYLVQKQQKRFVALLQQSKIALFFKCLDHLKEKVDQWCVNSTLSAEPTTCDDLLKQLRPDLAKVYPPVKQHDCITSKACKECKEELLQDKMLKTIESKRLKELHPHLYTTSTWFLSYLPQIRLLEATQDQRKEEKIDAQLMAILNQFIEKQVVSAAQVESLVNDIPERLSLLMYDHMWYLELIPELEKIYLANQKIILDYFQNGLELYV